MNAGSATRGCALQMSTCLPKHLVTVLPVRRRQVLCARVPWSHSSWTLVFGVCVRPGTQAWKQCEPQSRASEHTFEMLGTEVSEERQNRCLAVCPCLLCPVQSLFLDI